MTVFCDEMKMIIIESINLLTFNNSMLRYQICRMSYSLVSLLYDAKFRALNNCKQGWNSNWTIYMTFLAKNDQIYLWTNIVSFFYLSL